MAAVQHKEQLQVGQAGHLYPLARTKHTAHVRRIKRHNDCLSFYHEQKAKATVLSRLGLLLYLDILL